MLCRFLATGACDISSSISNLVYFLRSTLLTSACRCFELSYFCLPGEKWNCDDVISTVLAFSIFLRLFMREPFCFFC